MGSTAEYTSLLQTCEEIPLQDVSELKDATRKKPSLWSSSRQQLLILASLYASNILISLSFTLMAPFYPRVAEEKHMSQSVSGWVFGIFALVQFLFAPIAGKLCSTRGARFILLAGTFLSGGCTLLFGFLDKMPVTDDDSSVFTAYSFLIRIFLGIGCTSAFTASFVIASHTFPENGASALGILESSSGLGFTLGPGLSGFLYEAGGFSAPFVVIGLATIVPIPLMWCLLRGTDDHHDVKDQASIFCLLKVPVIWCILLSVMVTAISWTCLEPILEPHLREFDLRPYQLGLVFLLGTASYTVTTPFVGILTEKLDNSTPLLITGYAVTSVALLLIGPSPLIGLQSYKTLWLTILSLTVLGVGSSLAMVPTFGKLIGSAKKVHHGGTHGAVAGLFTSAYALGDFIAPIYAGAASEAFGFSWTMTSVGILTILMVIVTVILYMYERRTQYSHASGYT